MNVKKQTVAATDSISWWRWSGQTGWCYLAPSGPHWQQTVKSWLSPNTHWSLARGSAHSHLRVKQEGHEFSLPPRLPRRSLENNLIQAEALKVHDSPSWFIPNILSLLCFRLVFLSVLSATFCKKNDWLLAFLIWVTCYKYALWVCDVLQWSPSIMWLEQRQTAR